MRIKPIPKRTNITSNTEPELVINPIDGTEWKNSSWEVKKWNQ